MDFHITSKLKLSQSISKLKCNEHHVSDSQGQINFLLYRINALNKTDRKYIYITHIYFKLQIEFNKDQI